MKTRHAGRKSPMHFEQVPLEVVKKIADRKAVKAVKGGLPAGSIAPDIKRPSAARSK
jgi:hypothetical protein